MQNIFLKIPFRIELAKTLGQGHWYHVWKGKKHLGVYPSSTTILTSYPTSQHLVNWIARNGIEESNRIKSEAGDRGTRVHTAIELLLGGGELLEKDYALEEWYKIKAFVDWYKEYQPEDIAGEVALFSPKGKYAGRADRVMKINGELYVIDWKTSSNIHPTFPLQLSSYANALEEIAGLKIDMTAALQLGAKNKNKFRFVIYPEWQDHYKVFKNVQATWNYDYGDKSGSEEVLDLPDKLSLK